MWKSSAPKHTNSSFGYYSKDRLDTRTLCRRNSKALDSYNFILCNAQVEETLPRPSFFYCSLNQRCFHHLNIHLDTSLEPLEMIIQAHQSFHSSSFKCHHSLLGYFVSQESGPKSEITLRQTLKQNFPGHLIRDGVNSNPCAQHLAEHS